MRRPRIGARRGTAVLVLVASCAALLATSQPPDQAILSATHVMTGTVSAEAPRVAGTLRIALSAAALPVGSATIRSLGGGLKVTAGGVDRGRLVITLRGPAGPLVPATDPYGGTLVPIEQLCAAGEPCETEVDVLVEWLGASRGTISEVRVSTTLEVVYDGIQELPQGATAGLQLGAALAPAAPSPSLTAQTDDEQIVLDRDHWAAARHVRLTATPAALEGHTLAFLDHAVGQLDDGHLLVTVIADEDRGEVLDPAAPFDPFAGCERGAPCERGFTIRFELSMVDAEAVATIRWSFGARSAFPEVDAVPDGAELAATVADVADATTDAPAIEESLSGTLSFARDPERGRFPTEGLRLVVDVPPSALPAGAFGGLPPAARAILTVRGAVDGYLSVRVDADEERAQDVGAQWLAADGGATVLLNPLRHCQVDVACVATLDVSISPRPTDDVAGPIEITWQLDVVLAYPALEDVPRLARLELRQLPRGL